MAMSDLFPIPLRNKERSWVVTTSSIPQGPRSTSSFTLPLQPETTPQPLPEEVHQVPRGNPIYAHVMLACVLGVLFAITISSPVHPSRPADGQTSIAAQMAATVPAAAKTTAPADLPAQLVRDLGTVSSGAGGLKGHLSTTWSEKLDYQLEMQPSDPAERDAFAKTVSSSPKPLSVDFALRSAA